MTFSSFYRLRANVFSSIALGHVRYHEVACTGQWIQRDIMSTSGIVRFVKSRVHVNI